MKSSASKRKLYTVLAVAGLIALMAALALISHPRKTPEQAPDEMGLMRIYCFNAGKADAFLIMSDECTVLIDAGDKGFGKTILNYMEEHGIEKLDCVIISHFDKDHVGGASAVLRSVPVGCVYGNGCEKDIKEYKEYVKAVSTEGVSEIVPEEPVCVDCGGFSLRIVPAAYDYTGDSASNNNSLFVEVTCGERRFLFTGDAENARLKEYAASKPGSFDFVKIPYHGHWQKSLAKLISAVTPAYAVITSSNVTPEDSDTLGLLKSSGVTCYLTREGAVTIDCDGENIRITQ